MTEDDPLAAFRLQRCTKCNYDLRGATEHRRCPECGLDCDNALLIEESQSWYHRNFNLVIGVSQLVNAGIFGGLLNQLSVSGKHAMVVMFLVAVPTVIGIVMVIRHFTGKGERRLSPANRPLIITHGLVHHGMSTGWQTVEIRKFIAAHARMTARRRWSGSGPPSFLWKLTLHLPVEVEASPTAHHHAAMLRVTPPQVGTSFVATEEECAALVSEVNNRIKAERSKQA